MRYVRLRCRLSYLTPHKGATAWAKWADFSLAAVNAGVWATVWIGLIPAGMWNFDMQLTSLSVLLKSVYHKVERLSRGMEKISQKPFSCGYTSRIH